MIIRYANPRDIEAIAALWEEMVKELAPDYSPRRDWWERMAREMMKTDAYDALVAVSENMDRVVGFIDGFIFPEPSTGKVHAVGQHFYVRPEFREKGAAAGLYRRALRHARDRGAEVMELFCFTEERRMWGRHGFRPVRTLMRREIC